MRIVSFQSTPIAELPHRNARPGRGGSYVGGIPVYAAFVDALPEGLTSLVLASDLQGRALDGPALVGEIVPRWLIDNGLVVAPKEAIALLTGDLYAAPNADERGATGDVRAVWEAFASVFRAVAGVSGNHDLYGPETPVGFGRANGLHVLDGDVQCVAGLRVGGVSGIVGKPTRPNRKDEETFDRLLADVLLDGPDVVLLHQGPNGTGARDKGSARVRATLETLDTSPLVVFGHCRWEEPFTETEGRQFLNIEGRIVVVRGAGARWRGMTRGRAGTWPT